MLRVIHNRREPYLAWNPLYAHPVIPATRDPQAQEVFPCVDDKGRAETGVLDLTFLLRAKDGTWFAASAGWNDPLQAVEESKLIGLMQRVLYLLGMTAPKSGEAN